MGTLGGVGGKKKYSVCPLCSKVGAYVISYEIERKSFKLNLRCRCCKRIFTVGDSGWDASTKLLA